DLVQRRRALDFGRIEAARALVPPAERAGDEAGELRARFAALDGRLFDALRLLEAERTARPADPAVYAALAELYAAEQKFETAWSELKRGDDACGPSAELLRARGVLWIFKEGGAKKGLEFLERAGAADPELAFADRALAEAHLLVAKQCAKAENAVEARAHVDRALAFDPDDVDARRLQADLQAAMGDFTHALATLEDLCAKQEPLQGELALLCKKAAFGALLAKNRELALTRFARARELGLTDAELASGVEILADGARARRELGVAAYSKHDLERAEREFRAALAYAPGDVAAQNHLAVVLYETRRFAEAAELWRTVLATAEREGLELPEPVHVNRAKALFQAGDPAGAAAELERYLAAEPEGRWAAATRAAMANVPPSGVDSPREKQ
ncbi:MAG: hypothetical protein HZA53_03465, partial [Planctomycetes bacterium]|nr:hypothetical protein [Planctomycetota bacterium]